MSLTNRIARLTAQTSKPKRASLDDLEKRADVWTRRWMALHEIAPNVAKYHRKGLEDWTELKEETQAEYDRCHEAYQLWAAKFARALKRHKLRIGDDGISIVPLHSKP